MTAGAKLLSTSESAESRAKFKNENKMAVTYKAAVVSFIEELADDSIPQEARSCEGQEFLLFLLITSRETQSHVRIENYFERIIRLCSVSDFRSHFRMSRTTVSCLKRLLATCPGLPHGQRNRGRPTIDLPKQVLITMGTLNACNQWPIDSILHNKANFLFIAEFVE